MLELAPLPAAPEAVPNEAPPGPELSEVIPEPEQPPPVEIPPPVQAEVTLPEPEPPPPLDLKPPPPKPKPIEKKVERKPPQPRVSAPQAAPEQARTAAAPMPGASVDPPSQHPADLEGSAAAPSRAAQALSVGRPAGAPRGRDLCTVHDEPRRTRALGAAGARVGHAALDQEGLELLQRAQPLPPLPQDQPGESLEIVVPIQFFLRR